MAFSFIFSGFGHLAGVPMIGKEYPPEFLANPKNHRTRPSIYVATEESQAGGGYDAGIPHPDAAGDRSGWLDAVLFTHSHADHIMGLDDCRRFCDLRGGKALAGLCERGHDERFEAGLRYAFHDGAAAKGISFPSRM